VGVGGGVGGNVRRRWQGVRRGLGVHGADGARIVVASEGGAHALLHLGLAVHDTVVECVAHQHFVSTKPGLLL